MSERRTRREGAPPWWRDAVFYEIYVRSFTDSDGDGIGDLAGIRSRLSTVADLGVDAVWLTPFYPSPMADFGYDVADPRGVDSRFGTLADVDGIVADAHRLGLRVLLDVVPNHSSSSHPWFVEALAAPPGSPARDRYLFRDGRGAYGELPPNNWRSEFGGPAWTRVSDGQWYLHLFAAEQPDLNWRNPDVGDDYERTLRFWLDRDVDGFRVDVAHALLKAPGFPDDPQGGEPELLEVPLPPTPMYNQPEVHDVWRRWRAVCDSYPGDRAMVGEVWLGDQTVVADYVRADELPLAFDFELLHAPWEAAALRDAVARSLDALARVGAAATWTLSNHDLPRHLSRYGAGDLGWRRARAAVLLLLALPGAAFLYAGEELGLPEVDLPDEALRDPVWERSGHTRRGRDGCRVPLPWEGFQPPYGFAPEGTETWLPMPDGWGPLTVAAEQGDPGSMRNLYRSALRLRRELPTLGDGELVWHDTGEHVLDFTRPAVDGAVRCVVNLGTAAAACPAGEILLASRPEAGTSLPPDTAVWLRAHPG